MEQTKLKALELNAAKARLYGVQMVHDAASGHPLRGFFPVEDLKMFRRIDGHMSGHVEMKYVPGVDMSTGSLGQGISVAVGMALAGNCLLYTSPSPRDS